MCFCQVLSIARDVLTGVVSVVFLSVIAISVACAGGRDVVHGQGSRIHPACEPELCWGDALWGLLTPRSGWAGAGQGPVGGPSPALCPWVTSAREPTAPAAQGRTGTGNW